MSKASAALLPLTAILLSAMLPIAALLSATPVSAAPFVGGTEPVRIVVRHRDLDLTDPADVAVLDQRIKSSVKRACPIATRHLSEIARARRCRQTAAQRAAADTEVAVAAAHADRPRLASADDRNAVAAQ